MLTNKNWETPYYAHIGDKDKLGNMWSANLHYLMTSGDKDTTIAENIFKDYLKRFDCGIGWNRY